MIAKKGKITYYNRGLIIPVNNEEPMDKNQYKDRINIVIEFIKENIGGKISLQEVSTLAGFSQYHFHRIFSAFTGETIGNFIRRIKLEDAAHRLKHNESNILEIGYKAGYETPAAFTRAFKQYFGTTPSGYKQGGNIKPSRQKTLEDYSYLKEIIMKNFIGIKNLEDMKVISVCKTGKYSESACEAWSILCKFAYSNSIGKENKVITPESKFIGIGYDNPEVTPEEKLRYDACITVDNDIDIKGEVKQQVIKGGKYAVFLHKGSYENLKDTYNAIFAEWLPESNHKLREIPCFEMYLNKDPRRTKPENLKTEIYIPIN